MSFTTSISWGIERLTDSLSFGSKERGIQTSASERLMTQHEALTILNVYHRGDTLPIDNDESGWDTLFKTEVDQSWRFKKDDLKHLSRKGDHPDIVRQAAKSVRRFLYGSKRERRAAREDESTARTQAILVQKAFEQATASSTAASSPETRDTAFAAVRPGTAMESSFIEYPLSTAYSVDSAQRAGRDISSS